MARRTNLEMDPELKDLSEELFAAEDCKSLLKKHVTPKVVDKYKNTKTSLGGTLAACMRSGVANLDSGVGIYASDPEAYDVFRAALDPIIRDYHKVPGHVKEISHPEPTFGDLDNLDFGDLDIDGKYVVSTRVRVGRSVKGYAFPPVIRNKDRLELESRVKEALATLPGGLAGTYYPLKGMDKATQNQLVEDHFLFNDHDRFLRAAGGYNDWPDGRGIFFNNNKTFLTWCNEEDHLRFISMQMGGNLAEVYRRLIKAVNHMEKTLPFAHHDRYGYLTFCPSNLGTTMRASVHARIPNVSQLANFDEICKNLNLQVRGIHGEHTESVGGVYDISNKRRLGLTEYQAVCEMAKGVSILLLMEHAFLK